MLGHVAKNDDNAIRKYYGKTYFEIAAVRIIWNRLDRAGVFDTLRDVAIVAALYGFTQATSGAIGSASTIPSLGDAKEQGEGIWKKIMR